MPEVIFTGSAGRIEGRFHPAKQKNAPIAIILHPHPQFGGTMNHQITYQLYYAFAHRNFAVLRFNFRGVGRSQGSFDHGTGELSDAASTLDVARTKAPNIPVAGKATVFVFPDLNTGNTTYKAVQRSANVISIGPMLQGLRRPVNDLSRGALIDDIVYTIALTAIQATQD